MTDPKPTASLKPTLLARKGGARPAMRPQLGLVQVDALARQIDDLGWNDMGDDAPEFDEAADIVSLTPDARFPAAHEPDVVRQQRTIAHRVAAERRSALASGRRAAFTLRVDAERHLKLRLACTIKGRSAQQLVTEAIDRLLADLPEVSTLADQIVKSPA
ncbi:MAG: hypothetical protein JSR96_09475 [Proteobacteria bacterium]|nr:hypothetical protein [Pseudomonadota bacterium]